MSHNKETVDRIIELKNNGLSHRTIAVEVFGEKKKQSSVHSILKRAHPDYVKEVIIEKDELLKVVSFDIETAPILSYHWGLFKQNIGINQIKEDWYVLMFSYKELGKPVQRVSQRQFDGYKSGRDCEEEVVLACWEVLDYADIVIAHNGRRFDKKKMNAKFLEYGLPEPSPYKLVDTLEIAKSNFALTSNKLDHLMHLLLDDRKLDTGGFELWIGCMNGDSDSWDIMEDYCDKDVTGLERVYLKIRGWDKRHPNVAIASTSGKEHCTVCGSVDLIGLKQTINTGISSFSSKRCNSCGHVMRTRVNIRTKEQRVNTLVNAVY